MRTLFFLSFCFILSHYSYAQIRPWMPPPDDLIFSASGTGRTTGHIGTLSITNKSSRAKTLEIPALEIPATATHQGYVVPEPSKVTVPGRQTVDHPLTGYCTRPDLPAPDAGTILPPINSWDSGSPIIKQSQELIKHTTQLQKDGQLTTPFSNNPQRERESIIQQTVWWYSVPAYDPCKQIFLSMDVRDTDWYEYKDEIDRGVSQLVDAIIRVGGAAGIGDFLPTPLDIPLRSAQPPVSSEKLPSLTATGTGRTTGHIADIICHNPTDKPINIQIGDGGSLLIPSNGGFQSYVVPSIPTIPLGPRDKITIPVTGYCADIHRPPVPGGTDMPPLSDWIESPGIRPVRPILGTTGPGELVRIPVSQALPLDEATRILVSEHVPPVVQGWDCPDIPQATDIMIPGTDSRLRAPVDLDRNPAVAAPVILETTNRIIESLETLYSNDMIRTPFSNNRQQERESIIQQTVWIYSASMKGEPYTKEDMRNKALDQLESATRQKYDNMPEQTRSTFDMGVEDIWGAINLVGVEAKGFPNVPLESFPESMSDQIWEPISSAKELYSDEIDTPWGTTSNFDPQDNFDPSMPVLQQRRPPKPPDPCTCPEQMGFKLNVVGDKEYVFSSGMVKVGGGRSETKKTFESDKAYEPDQEIEFYLDNFDLKCGKCKRKDCNKTNEVIRIRTGLLEDNNSSQGVEELTSEAGRYKLKLKSSGKNTGIFIRIEYDCELEGCSKIQCKDTFLFVIKAPCKCTQEDIKLTITENIKKKNEAKYTIHCPESTAEAPTTEIKIKEKTKYHVAINGNFVTCVGCSGTCKPEDVSYKLFEENERNNRSHASKPDNGFTTHRIPQNQDTYRDIVLDDKLELKDIEPNKSFVFITKAKCVAKGCIESDCGTKTYKMKFIKTDN